MGLRCGALLDGVGQLVGEQFAALAAGRVELTRAKMNLVINGKGCRIEGAAGLCGAGIAMNAHDAEIGTETSFHVLAHRLGQGFATAGWRLGRLLYRAGQRCDRRPAHRVGPVQRWRADHAGRPGGSRGRHADDTACDVSRLDLGCIAGCRDAQTLALGAECGSLNDDRLGDLDGCRRHRRCRAIDEAGGGFHGKPGQKPRPSLFNSRRKPSLMSSTASRRSPRTRLRNAA